MNWKLVFGLSAFGIIMGLLSVAGFTQGIEWLLWLLIALFSSYVISKRFSKRYFLAGSIVGVLDGVLSSLIKSALFGTYIANNPSTTEGFNQIPGGMSGQLFVLLIGFPIGAIYGIVIGLLTLLAVRLFKKSSTGMVS